MLRWVLLNGGLLSAGSAGGLAEESDRSAKASYPTADGVRRQVLVCRFRIFMWRPGWSQTKLSPKLLSQYTWGSGVQDCSRGAQGYEDGLDIPCLVVESVVHCWGFEKVHLVVVPDPGCLDALSISLSCSRGVLYSASCWALCPAELPLSIPEETAVFFQAW